jgi:hypothetical protein
MSPRGPKAGSRSGDRPAQSTRSRKQRGEFEDYSIVDPREISEGPDVLVDVPQVKVDEIDIEVDELRAQVAVLAEVRNLVQLSVGADVRLGKVELRIEGVEAQALLKARLGNVTAILERALTTLDRNPDLLRRVGQAAERVGGGAGEVLGDTAEAAGRVGEGAGETLEEVGRGGRQAAEQVGGGVQQAVGKLAPGS